MDSEGAAGGAAAVVVVESTVTAAVVGSFFFSVLTLDTSTSAYNHVVGRILLVVSSALSTPFL